MVHPYVQTSKHTESGLYLLAKLFFKILSYRNDLLKYIYIYKFSCIIFNLFNLAERISQKTEAESGVYVSTLRLPYTILVKNKTTTTTRTINYFQSRNKQFIYPGCFFFSSYGSLVFILIRNIYTVPD